MTISRVEAVSAISNGATPGVVTIPLASATAAGELIVVFTIAGAGGSSSGTLTDDHSQVYSPIFAATDLGGHGALTLWQRPNSVAGVSTVTYTMGGTDNHGGACLAHYTGLTDSPLDKVSNGGAWTQQDATTSFASDPISTAQPVELIVGCAWTFTDGGIITIDSPMTLETHACCDFNFDGNNGQDLAYADRIVAATQAGATVSGTSNGSASSIFSGIASFIGGTQVPVVHGPGALLGRVGSR